MPTFLDEAQIVVRAGNGGAGSMHFRREKYVPNGGPDGGDGGNGGSIILEADRGMNTLYGFQRNRRFSAESGEPGAASRMNGGNGEDLLIKVPVGTVVRSEDGEVLGDLRATGQRLVVAAGGKGGLGNVHFKSSTNQAPHFAEKGEPGREHRLDLELKLIADVGLIGSPNAGKSTLLSVISAARPKIADYPFTTLVPNLGVVEADEYTFVAADIPGLIEGAHAGVGLGHEFLRHVERTLVLLHLVDGNEPDPVRTFTEVRDELVQYDGGLLEKPQIVVITKMDLPDARDRWPELQAAFTELGYETRAISSAIQEGVEALVYRTADVLREQKALRAEETEPEAEIITIKPPAGHFEIERKRRTFHVTGEQVERLAIMTDLESDEALYRLQRRLRQMGLFSALERMGIEEGSTVRIGDVDLIWDSSYEPAVKATKRSSGGTRGKKQ
ncbi:MAG: GTPase ObgE [Chloroflexota bacterium]